MRIWESRPHYCEECGIFLTEPRRHNFAHILPKSHYPAFRHNPENIVLLCLEHHTQLDAGKKYNLRIWPQLEVTIQTLKLKYHE